MRSILAALCLALATAISPGADNVKVYFSPKGGCTEAVVEALNTARTTVYVQAYSFTSAPIAKALVDAQKRGVKVQAILDKSQKTEKYSEADFLHNSGVPTLIDAKHAIAHNKIMVIDGQTILTGSFNFTKAAESNNAENLLVIQDSALAAKYLANWKEHAGHSEAYERRERESTAESQAGGPLLRIRRDFVAPKGRLHLLGPAGRVVLRRR
jgi:phosphatidylserine/phosphatidylglycerophosphate/cardiolipin synthase-like enzyme